MFLYSTVSTLKPEMRREKIRHDLFGSLSPSQQFFSHVGEDLPGLDQYYTADKMSCSNTHHSDSASSDSQEK